MHAVRNVSLGTLNASAVSLLFSSATIWICRWSKSNSFGLMNCFELSPAVKGISACMLFDLWMYLWHIANHRIQFFWRFHRVHHADLEMDLTTALRFHTGEVLLSSLIRLAVVPAIGMEFVHLLLYEICLQPVIIFHHSNIALPEKWDRILRLLIVTPNMHRVHHSQERSETNSSYASIFSFWDRIGKTFRTRENSKTIVYGLPEFQENEWKNFRGMIKIPFVNF